MDLNPTQEHVCGGTFHFQGYVDNAEASGPSFKCDKCGEEAMLPVPFPTPGERVAWVSHLAKRNHGVMVLVKVIGGDLYQMGVRWDGSDNVIALPHDDWGFWFNVQRE